MRYRGKIKGGVVILEAGINLPEGADVSVEPIISDPTLDTSKRPMIWAKLLELAGSAGGLRKDSATQHDHYLYGTPKR